PERHCQRHDEAAALADGLTDQPAHVVDEELEEQLELARHAMTQPVGDQETDDERDDDGDRARDQAVVVEGAVPGTADTDGGMGAGRLSKKDHPASASRTANPARTS